jgi:Predicted pyridoxal phosphate-dependent enzyme apparently involved in regulation of cell wall biogenesis
VIPRLRPDVGFREFSALFRPARKNAVQLFEDAFARRMEQAYAIAFPYGRIGLLCLLEALGIRNREIICPAWTCVVVPHAVVRSGNEPVFVDSARSDYNMNLDLAEAEIGGRTGALIATSLFGMPVDLDRLEQLRVRHPHIPIIQDCAHSFGASWNGGLVQKQGVAAVFGLNVSKLMTSIFGGMVTTDNPELAKELRTMRNRRMHKATLFKSWKRRLYFIAAASSLRPVTYGLVNRLERWGALDAYTRYYDEARIDLPGDSFTGMSAVEAEIGLVQTTRYGAIVDTRRRNAAVYHRRLSGLPELSLPRDVPGHTYSHFTVLTPHRERLMKAALAEGIQLGMLVEYCIPDMPAYAGRAGFRDCPVARRLSEQCVNLPIWGESTEPVLRFFERYNAPGLNNHE